MALTSKPNRRWTTKLAAEKAGYEKQRDSATDESTKALWDQRATDTGDKQVGAQHELARIGPDPNDISAQLSHASAGIAQSMGTVAEQIGGTWKNLGETMRTSMGSALYDMLERSKNFKQAAGSFFVSIGQSLAHSLTQMVADWTMSHLVMDNVRTLFLAMGLVKEKVATTAETAIHTGGEVAKTGATGAGVAARSGLRVTETIIHGIQVGIRTAMHLAGEIAQTAVTLAQSALRIAATIAESLVSIIKAAAGAMSAMASIPYVGPILAIAAAGAMIAEGSSLIKGARESGGPVEAGSAYLVGEKRPEIFVPGSDGYIFPDAGSFSAPALPTPGRPSTAMAAASQAASAAGGRGTSGSGEGGQSSTVNHHYYIDREVFRSAMEQDMRGIAHEVYLRNVRKGV